MTELPVLVEVFPSDVQYVIEFLKEDLPYAAENERNRMRRLIKSWQMSLMDALDENHS